MSGTRRLKTERKTSNNLSSSALILSNVSNARSQLNLLNSLRADVVNSLQSTHSASAQQPSNGLMVGIRPSLCRSGKHNPLYKKGTEFCIASKWEEALEQYHLGFKNFLKSKDKKSKDMQIDYFIAFARCHTALENYGQALEEVNKARNLSSTGGDIFNQLLEIHLYAANLDAAKKVFNNLSSFSLNTIELAQAYDIILRFANKGMSFLKIDDKFKPDDAKTIFQEMSDFLISMGNLRSKFDYEQILMTEYFNNKQFEQVLKYSIQHCKHEDINIKMVGLYRTGMAYFEQAEANNEQINNEEKNADKEIIKEKEKYNYTKICLAVNFLKEIIKIYKQEANPPEQHSRYAALAAYTLGEIYNGSYCTKFWNVDEAISYYTFSAERDFPPACHRLGYKYQYGEDVEEDTLLAAKYYQIAANNNHLISCANLGGLKLFCENTLDEPAGLVLLIKALDDPDSRNIAAGYLSNYYIKECYAYFDNKKSINLELLKNAIKYTQLAIEYEMAAGNYNMGLLYLDGIITSTNPRQALQYFQKSFEQGASEAIPLILKAYAHLFINEKDVAISKQYYSECDLFAKANGCEISREKFEELFKQKIQRSTEIHARINSTFGSCELHEIDRIHALLKTDLDELNSNNLCMLVHRLGFLWDKNFGTRDFYQENYDKLCEIIDKVHLYLHDKVLRFDTAHLSFLIVGLSKLYLKCDYRPYKITIEKLFARAVNDVKKLAQDSRMNIIFSATRLDSDINIFDDLKVLIDSLFEEFDKLNRTSLIDLLHVIVTLNSQIIPAIPSNCILKLVQNCVNHSTGRLHVVEANKLYLSFRFLTQKKEWQESIPWDCLERLKKCILFNYKKTPSTNRTKLQNNVIYCLSQLIDPRNIKEEKLITTYPVDALIRKSPTTAIILQVDGPTHYLHGKLDKNPKISPRTQFRNDYLGFLYPVITVPYYEWGKLKGFKDSCSYLKKLIDSIEVKPNLTKTTINRHNLFVNTTRIAFQPSNELPSGALSGVYYTPSPKQSTG